MTNYRFDMLMQNSSFVRRLVLAETIEDAVRAFADEGVMLTARDLEMFVSASREAELNEAQLEHAAGGSQTVRDPYLILAKLMAKHNRG